MYVKIDDSEYKEITELQFNPSADLTGSTVPVNELWVNIKTDDEIPVGSRVSLYDDNDRIWAKYWVTYSERENARFKRVHGQSALFKLGQVPLEPIMYDDVTVEDALGDVLAVIGDEYQIDDGIAQETLNGYCPKQTARVRLQWICMAVGAYIREFFDDHMSIVPYGNVISKTVKKSDVYWKPTVNYSDYVTAVVGTYYSYQEGVPSRQDKYVEVGGRTYIQMEDSVTLRNPDVPEIALENVMEISNMTLLNSSNVDAVLSRIALYNFKRMSVNMDIVDNGEVEPAQAILTYSDEDQVVTGFVKSASFKFGMRARAGIELVGCEVTDGAWLTVNYVWNEMTVGMKRFYFPVGLPYETSNPYLDVTFADGHRYVLRPINDGVSGTMQSGGNTVTEEMTVALEYLDGALYTVSADELNAIEGRYKDGDVVVYT